MFPSTDDLRAPMTIIILIPALCCVIGLLVWPVPRVFRNIVLPVLLLCPLIYVWKVKLLPPVDFSEGVLLPLGLAMALRCWRRWRFTFIDLWMIPYLVSTFWADHTLGRTTSSVFVLFNEVCISLVPYMAGKLLIEQDDARVGTLKRIVHLLVGVTVVACTEWFVAVNPWERILSPVFPIVAWTRQFRAGHARMTGPFWQAELAGTMLMMGVVLALWLSRYAGWGQRARSTTWLRLRRSTLTIGILVLGVYFTGSRGPELGLLFAVPVALVGRSRRVLRSALLAAVFLAGGGAVVYVAVTNYSATREPSSEQQQTAMYRAIMIEHYLPLAEHSGAWGYGPQFPTFGIFKSIDNEYLLLALVQGWVGLVSFLAISAGTVYSLIWCAIYKHTKSDKAFAFTLLGVFTGMLVILATVFLGYQPHIFFFLIAGWSQALKSGRESGRKLQFQQVYT